MTTQTITLPASTKRAIRHVGDLSKDSNVEVAMILHVVNRRIEPGITLFGTRDHVTIPVVVNPLGLVHTHLRSYAFQVEDELYDFSPADWTWLLLNRSALFTSIVIPPYDILVAAKIKAVSRELSDTIRKIYKYFAAMESISLKFHRTTPDDLVQYIEVNFPVLFDWMGKEGITKTVLRDLYWDVRACLRYHRFHLDSRPSHFKTVIPGVVPESERRRLFPMVL